MKLILTTIILTGLIFSQVQQDSTDIQKRRAELLEARTKAIGEIENWTRTLDWINGGLQTLDLLELDAIDTTK